ncbi:MAG TPA: universal stress protein [Cyclobacteriaceae bacterium]
MKNIVIPVDFSDHSRSAAYTGAFLALKSYARIHLLHVVQGPENWSKLTVENRKKHPEVESRIVEVNKQLEELSRDAMFHGLNVVTQVKTGIAHERIVSYAQATNADLVIIGAHGADESDPVFIGSTAQKVMRAASCPVLSVKKNFNPGGVKHILFASDFEENVSDALNFVTELAVAMNTSIDLAFINTPGHFVDSETIERRMLDVQPKKPGVVINHFVYNHYDKDRGIIEAARKRQAGVIAMITHNRKGKAPYSFGITESVLFLADAGVLSVIVKK